MGDGDETKYKRRNWYENLIALNMNKLHIQVSSRNDFNIVVTIIV